MLLLPFIENAFKHGVSATEKGHIAIRIAQQDNQLILHAENNIFANTTAQIDDGGIGLTNTRRRLNLLYKNQHQLTTCEMPDNIYQVHLELNLL
jgi:sensor histidine kinase YesM